MAKFLGSGDAARGTTLATRTMSLGEYWMTTGAFLPIPSKEAFQKACSSAGAGKHKLLEGPGGVALLMVRVCLASGAADWAGYEPVKP
jgi:hypothetical protein